MKAWSRVVGAYFYLMGRESLVGKKRFRKGRHEGNEMKGIQRL